MANAFDSPDVVEMKGKVTGVTRLSRKLKAVVLFSALAVMAFVLVSITTMDDSPTADVGDNFDSQSETANKRAVEPAKPNFAGIGDGQASLVVAETEPPPMEAGMQPTFPVGSSKSGARDTGSSGGVGVPAVPAVPPAAARLPAQEQYQSPEEAAAAARARQVEDMRRRAVEGNLEMEGGGEGGLGRGAAVAGNGPGSPSGQLAALVAAAQNAGQAGQSGGLAGGAALVPAIGQSQDDPNKQTRKENFLRGAEGSQKTYLNERVQTAVSSFELKAGWVIPAALECGVNSDLPGQTCARVTENVFDTATGTHLLIPQGSKLIGSYDSQVAYGQTRILAVWNRLIFPDGSSISLNGMPGADKGGYAGFDADVDNHYSRIFGGALLMATFSAGISMTQKQNTNTNGVLTNSQVVTQEVGRQLGQTGAAVIQRGMNIQPTLSREPGYKFNVMTTRDIVFPGSYTHKPVRE
ncbi:TrbI/VirB10 family protein [Paracidovorax citrulli]